MHIDSTPITCSSHNVHYIGETSYIQEDNHIDNVDTNVHSKPFLSPNASFEKEKGYKSPMVELVMACYVRIWIIFYLAICLII